MSGVASVCGDVASPSARSNRIGAEARVTEGVDSSDLSLDVGLSNRRSLRDHGGAARHCLVLQGPVARPVNDRNLTVTAPHMTGL